MDLNASGHHDLPDADHGELLQSLQKGRVSSAVELETLYCIQGSEIDFVELTVKKQCMVLASISDSQPEAI